MSIAWRELAEELGTITYTEGGYSQRGGTDVACDALRSIVGNDELRRAVDFYVTWQPGSELVRSVLWLLEPPAAMERCLEIFRETDDPEVAVTAIELLKVVADRRALAWVPEFLASENVVVRRWTIGLIDQLLIMKEEITEDEAMPFIQQGLDDRDEGVKAQAAQVIEMLKHNASVERLGDGAAA